MNPSEIRIRLGGESDADALVHSALEMIRETEGGNYSAHRVRSGVLKILSNSERGFYVVAEHQERVVGSLQVSPHWLDLFDGCMWWLQCAYVDPSYRKTGCFKRMREYVFDLGKKNPEVRMFRSTVHPENKRMQKINEELGWQRSKFFNYNSGRPDMGR